MRKLAALSAFLAGSLFLSARADLTIVEKVEGTSGGEMIIKIKGDKARVEASSGTVTIMDRKTGEMIHLIKDQKAVVRISPEKVRAAMEMINKFEPTPRASAKPKLTDTGKGEVINGYQTEQYVFKTPKYKATYWIARDFPDAAAILNQLRMLSSGVWKPQGMEVPDYGDLPGVPIKTVMTINGHDLTTVLVSLKQDRLNDSEFSVPSDFHEVKTPDIQSIRSNASNPVTSPTP